MKERRARRSAVCHQASAPRSASRAAPAVVVAEVEVAVLICASYPGAESAFPFSSADTAIHSPLQPPSPFEPARAATRRGQLSSPIVCDRWSHHTPFRRRPEPAIPPLDGGVFRSITAARPLREPGNPRNSVSDLRSTPRTNTRALRGVPASFPQWGRVSFQFLPAVSVRFRKKSQKPRSVGIPRRPRVLENCRRDGLNFCRA